MHVSLFVGLVFLRSISRSLNNVGCRPLCPASQPRVRASKAFLMTMTLCPQTPVFLYKPVRPFIQTDVIKIVTVSFMLTLRDFVFPLLVLTWDVYTYIRMYAVQICLYICIAFLHLSRVIWFRKGVRELSPSTVSSKLCPEMSDPRSLRRTPGKWC